MNLSEEEKIMYEVMESIYDSGIPICFKGSMVLRAYLIEAGYTKDTRHTVDIDASFYANPAPSTEQIAESFQKALDMKGLDICISPYRQHGEKRSAGFELKNKETEELIFTMDVDVNRHYPEGKIYEVSGFSFQGAVVNQMIADKLICVSTDKVFRRIKDVVDLYYISEVIEMDKESVERILKENSLSIGDFDGFLNRKNDLKHSYDKFLFAGDVDKPLFDEVYEKVKEYILDFLKK